MKRTVLVVVMIGLLFIAFEGCVNSYSYYYDPYCPNCVVMAPYVDYLEEQYHISIEKYNVEEGDYPNIKAVPTLVINNKKFVGRTDIVKAEYTIATITGNPPPKEEYNTSYRDPAVCLKCHAKTEQQEKLNLSLMDRREELLPPPSTYSCDACCH